jgi:hypothetical protein
MSDRAKDAEILALRHQTTVLERHLHGEKIRFTRTDRAWLATLLHQLPRDVLREIRLLIRPSQAHATLAADFFETTTLTGPAVRPGGHRTRDPPWCSAVSGRPG